MVKIHDIRSQTKRSNGTRPESAIKNIARHHSATASGDFFSFWKHWNGTNGWGTGGYHEIILRDGSLQLCYDPNEITNGIGNHNGYVYHICVVGNGSFTAAQEATWRERCHLAMKRFNLPVSAVKGHNEFSGASTACPGINMNTVRKALQGNNVDQVSKPVQNLPSNVMGTVESLVPSLNVRADAKFDAKVLKTITTGDVYKVYNLKNGLYDLGGNQWISAGKNFVHFTANPAYKSVGASVAPKPTPAPAKPKPVTPTTNPREEAVRMFKPTTKTLKNEFIQLLDKAAKDGVVKSPSWKEKAEKDQLPIDDAVALIATLLNRK